MVYEKGAMTDSRLQCGEKDKAIKDTVVDLLSPSYFI